MNRRGVLQMSRRQPAAAVVASGAAPFTPKSIANMVLWLDATVGVPGSPVSSWADQSGGGVYTNAVQGTAAKQPTLGTLNGKTCLVGTAATGLDLGTATPTAGNVFSCFAVFNTASIPQFASMLARYYALINFAFGSHLGGADNKCGFAVNGGAGSAEAVSNAALNDSLTHTIVGTYNGGSTPSTRLYVDGVLQTVTGQASGNLLANSTDHIGAMCETDNANSISGAVGKYGELGMYAAELTQANVNALRAYWQTKWAAQ